LAPLASARLGRVDGFRTAEAKRFAKRHSGADAIVLIDGLVCFRVSAAPRSSP